MYRVPLDAFIFAVPRAPSVTPSVIASKSKGISDIIRLSPAPTLLPKAYDKESNCDLLPIVIEPLLRLHEAKITAPANSAMKHNVLFILLI